MEMDLKRWLHLRRLLTVSLLGLPVWLAANLSAQVAGSGVAAVLINVVQNDISNTVDSVTVTAAFTVGDLTVREDSNRGDINLQVGIGLSDDVDSGVVMTCVAQNGRDNGEVAYPGVNYCTTAIDYSRSGGSAGAYYMPVFQAPTGDEFNLNVAAAFFSYSNWLGGFARNLNASNGFPNDLFTGSPGLVLGTHYVNVGGGTNIVNLASFGIDARTDGVLLVTHGKNEDNYALSQVNSNNGTWTVYVKDNGTDAGAYEQDPVAFVYIPKTNTLVISGRFRADGTRLIYSGAAPSYSVTNTGTGTWRLTIPGHSPNSGVLLISAEGGMSQNQDNIVSYEPDGDGWIIQSRDLPASTPGLQTPGGGGEPVANFVFIPAAATANLQAPLHNSAGQPNAPNLVVAVSNTAPGNLTVKYYGRTAEVNPAVDFAIVALPDTQFYTGELNGGTKEMFIAQAEWIITNRVSRNIAYVAHLGDFSQNGDIKSGGDNRTEWRNGTNAMYRLENSARTQLAGGIPYGVAVGNHDEEPIGDSTGTTLFYNEYFGVSHFTGKPYYAGHWGTNNNNHFDFFSAGGMDFIVIYLQYDSTLNPAWLNWANDVLRTNQNRRAIMVTHNFGNTSTPVSFSAQGAAIYNAVKTNKNVFMMLAGHVTGEGSRADTYQGNTIRTFVSDYQGWTNGGSGFMRIIDFSPSRNEVVFTTYSPYFNTYSTAATSEIFFDYDMSHAVGSNGAPYELIGTISNLPASSLASLPWPGRQSNTAYEWYVVVSDEAGNSATSPAWRFTTAPNTAPTVANALLTIYGDAPTNLNLVATDPNGDPLTFQTNTLPLHGVLSPFVPLGGSYTYIPVRGYRGSDRFTFSAHDGTAGSSVATMNFNIIAPPDTNASGLPDGWEAMFGVSNPGADDDGDGETNLQEYYANTNPTNAASVLQITSTTRAVNGHVTLTWPTIGGTRYRIQYSNGTAGGGFDATFTDVIRPLNVELDPAPHGTASAQTFVDDFTQTGGAPPYGKRLYRIKVIQ